MRVYVKTKEIVYRENETLKRETNNQLVQGKPTCTTDNSYPENSSDRHRDPELAYKKDKAQISQKYPLSLGAFGVFPMVQMWNYHWYRWLPMVPMVATKLRTVLAYQWHDSTFLLISDPHRPQTSQSLGPDANFAFRRCDAIIWGWQYIFFLKI